MLMETFITEESSQYTTTTAKTESGTTKYNVMHDVRQIGRKTFFFKKQKLILIKPLNLITSL